MCENNTINIIIIWWFCNKCLAQYQSMISWLLIWHKDLSRAQKRSPPIGVQWHDQLNNPHFSSLSFKRKTFMVCQWLKNDQKSVISRHFRKDQGRIETKERHVYKTVCEWKGDSIILSSGTHCGNLIYIITVLWHLM